MWARYSLLHNNKISKTLDYIRCHRRIWKWARIGNQQKRRTQGFIIVYHGDIKNATQMNKTIYYLLRAHVMCVKLIRFYPHSKIEFKAIKNNIVIIMYSNMMVHYLLQYVQSYAWKLVVDFILCNYIMVCLFLTFFYHD